MENLNDFLPSVPLGEQQATYEFTPHTIEPLVDAADGLPIVRKDLPGEIYPKDYGFLLYNVLSPKECKHYIDEAEKLGLISVSSNSAYRIEYRNNDRVCANSLAISQLIWERIKPFIKDIEITEENLHRVGTGYRLEGHWQPVGLNEVWRICKYHPGGHFAPHYDGNFIRNAKERSMKTFMLYLNEEFDGGSTNFIDEQQKLHKDPNSGVYKAEEANILFKIKPVPGMAIVFNHMILHEGEQVHNGLKYIMRSDVMFCRDGKQEVNPKEVEALQLFQQAERLEANGSAMEAAECYRKAFKMWPPLADAYNS